MASLQQKDFGWKPEVSGSWHVVCTTAKRLQGGHKQLRCSVRCLVKKPELSKLFKSKDIEGREAALGPKFLLEHWKNMDRKDVGHAVHLLNCVSRNL